MIKDKTGDIVMMTRFELWAENKKVLHAWGSSYLNFNLKHFVELADEQYFRLWEAMLKVDAMETVEEKIEEMHKLLAFLNKK